MNISVRLGDIDKYQFEGSYFDLPITLVSDKHGELIIDPAGVELDISLKFEDGGAPSDAVSALTIDSRTPTLLSAAQSTLRVMINTLSMKHDNKAFVLHVSASSPAYRYIGAGMSTGIICIKYQLRIVTKLADVWYKDEGGRDKCMDMMIQLVNSSGHLVTDRRVPLRLVLKYESGQDVSQQELFKISPESRRVIDDTGSATIKFRIDDVSKNHQKQAFAVMVAADVTAVPLNADIGGAISAAVDIKSKRNKRKLDDADDSVVRPLVANSRTRNNIDIDSLDINSQGLNNPATNIYSWIQHVLNAIEAVSWKRVGFERRADGSEDRNKPLHAMSNPNEIVDQMKAQFHELQVENSLLVLSRLYDDALSGKTSGTSSAPNFMSNSSRGLSSMLGNDPLAGIRGLSSSPMSMPPPPPQLSRHVGSREGSTSLAGHGFPDFAPAPERTPSMWRQQSLEYFGSCVETMMDSIFDQQEIDVNGIFAIDYQAKRSLKKIGMPAFNSKNELIGFYKYVDGGRVLFLPVDDSMDLCPEDFEYLRREAEKSLDEQPLIVRMGSNSFEYVKDLDRLKEDALKEMWRTNSSW